MFKATIIILLGIIHIAVTLKGYDCGRNSPNITTFAINKVANCEDEETNPIVINMNIQLLQKVEHTPTYVRACRIKVNRQIKYCDWRKYATTVKEEEFFHSTTREECDEIHEHGRLDYEKSTIKNLLPNVTNHKSLTIAGQLEGDGDCSGATFTAGDTTYKSSVVMVKLEINVYDRVVAANRDKQEMILPSGTRCSLKAGKCIDAEHYNVYWTYQPIQACDFDQFAILFQGKGVRVGNSSENEAEVYFGNSTNGIQFGLTKTGEISLCGFTIYKTEHQKLFITEYAVNQGPPARKILEVEDIILTAYFNTKIAFLARHMKSQFVSMYRDIMIQKCELERRMIQNSLLHIDNRPDIVAMILMKKRGYMAIKAGEAAHMISCEETYCKIRRIEGCYQEIPVTCRNESYFLKPESHIMTRAGTPTDCNALLPTMFEIEGVWHQFTPTISGAREPQILKPRTIMNWKYQDVRNLIESGIYGTEDLEKLEQHFLFPAERAAILEETARKLSERSTGGILTAHFGNLIDKDIIEQITESKLRKLWDGFTQFGTYAAGVMGILTIFHMIKLLADTVIRGYTLKSMYGWSIHMLGAVWGSLTHLLVTMAHMNQESPEYDVEAQKQKQGRVIRREYLEDRVNAFVEDKVNNSGTTHCK